MKPKNIWIKISLAVVILIMVYVGSSVLGIYNDVKETISGQMYQPLPAINQIDSEEKVVQNKPINLLLLAINKEKHDKGRAESLIVVSLNPTTDSMTLVTIPRNTRALMVGKEMEDKINHAFAYGGPNMAIHSVENLLDIELDYYVQLNLKGVADLIDGLGGITINNELELELEEEEFQLLPGELHLNGTQAVKYVEMLDNYQGEDLDSTELQNQIFEAIIQKGTTAITMNKVETFANFLGDNLITNIDFYIIEHLLRNYSDVGKNVTEHMLEGSETEIDGVKYLIISEEEIEKVR